MEHKHSVEDMVRKSGDQGIKEREKKRTCTDTEDEYDDEETWKHG